MPEINWAGAALLVLLAAVLALLAGQSARAAAYRRAGWRVRAWVFGWLCLLLEKNKRSLKPGSPGADRGAFSLGSVIPVTPDIASEASFQAAKKILPKRCRQSDFMAAYALYALLPLQEDGELRRAKNVFLRDKLAGALGALQPQNADKYALEAFDLLLMEHMARPGLPVPPALERWLDHFAQDYQALRRGKTELHTVLFLHVLYALKLRGDDRWKVMEAHVSTLINGLPGQVREYYRTQTQQLIYNHDHRETLCKRENIRGGAAWRLTALFEDALEDEIGLNRRGK